MSNNSIFQQRVQHSQAPLKQVLPNTFGEGNKMDKTHGVSFFDLQLFKEVNATQQPSETLIKPLL